MATKLSRFRFMSVDSSGFYERAFVTCDEGTPNQVERAIVRCEGGLWRYYTTHNPVQQPALDNLIASQLER
jgi:hypothetical protein